MGGGAWPFLVGGVICLVNSVNERDLSLLNSCANRSNSGEAASAVGAVAFGSSHSPACGSLMQFANILLRGTIAYLAEGSLRQ